MRTEIYDDYVDEYVPEYTVCPMCHGCSHELGELGSLTHFRCRDCGYIFTDSMESHND